MGGLHRHIFIVAVQRGNIIELVAKRAESEQAALEYMQRVEHRRAPIDGKASLWVVGDFASARDIHVIGTITCDCLRKETPNDLQ